MDTIALNSKTLRHDRRRSGVAMLQAAPLALVLTAFLIGPLTMIAVVSFWRFSGFGYAPAFQFLNYGKLFTSATTFNLYWNTTRLLVPTLIATLVLGYTIAFHLAFDIRRTSTRSFLFALTVVPFLTSSVVRTIAWVPFLGRNGIVNTLLIETRLIDAPLSFLLFSEFAVVLCYVQMFTGFMVAPIFNLMIRIEPELIEAARDAGASGYQVFRWIILPLTLPGAAIGAIFVIVMLVSDVSIVRLIGGGQTGTVAIALYNQVGLVQFPPACAAAMLLLGIVLLIVTPILRVVDIRRQL